MRAIAELFKSRQAGKRIGSLHPVNEISEENPGPLIFERICYESLIYHGSIMMLYDRDSDMLADNLAWKTFDDYFRTSPLPCDAEGANWPILGIPYNLFRLIVGISILSRRSPLNDQDLHTAAAMGDELAKWAERTLNPMETSFSSSPHFFENNDDESNHHKNTNNIRETSTGFVGILYILVAKILLSKIVSRQLQGTHPLESVQNDVRHCMSIVRTTDISCQFSRYHLWPLSVLNHITVKTADKRTVRDKMEEIMQNMDGGGALAGARERIQVFLEVPGL